MKIGDRVVIDAEGAAEYFSAKHGNDMKDAYLQQFAGYRGVIISLNYPFASDMSDLRTEISIDGGKGPHAFPPQFVLPEKGGLMPDDREYYDLVTGEPHEKI